MKNLSPPFWITDFPDNRSLVFPLLAVVAGLCLLPGFGPLHYAIFSRRAAAPRFGGGLPCPSIVDR